MEHLFGNTTVANLKTVAITTLLTAVLSAGSASAQPVFYRVEHFPGGTTTTTRQLSADGSVAVGFGDSPGGERAIRWTASGGTQDLGLPPGSSLALGFGVSSDGMSYGGYCRINGQDMAYIWTDNGPGINIGDLFGQGSQSEIYAMSADGTIGTGGRGLKNEPHRAIRWSKGGIQNLGLLHGSHASIGIDISANGDVIAGNSFEGSSITRTFRWTENAGMQDLGFLPAGTFAYAGGISDNGAVIVGGSGRVVNFQSIWQYAYCWTADGGMRNLGTINAADDISVAYSSNSNGAIIGGTSGVNETRVFKAFIWTAELGMIDVIDYLVSLGIDLTGWELETVLAISGDGSAITGKGTFQNSEYAWVVQGLTLVPPCPADTNHDGVLTPADFTAWIAAFNAMAPECDQNGDGSCTPADFTAWIADFNAGC